MKTIKAAVASADDGDIILIAPGVYREIAPIDITVNNLSVVGQSLRSVFVHPTPATEENTLFRVNSGTLLSNMTFAGIKASGTRGGHATDSDSTYGLPANQVGLQSSILMLLSISHRTFKTVRTLLTLAFLMLLS